MQGRQILSIALIVSIAVIARVAYALHCKRRLKHARKERLRRIYAASPAQPPDLEAQIIPTEEQTAHVGAWTEQEPGPRHAIDIPRPGAPTETYPTTLSPSPLSTGPSPFPAYAEEGEGEDEAEDVDDEEWVEVSPGELEGMTSAWDTVALWVMGAHTEAILDTEDGVAVMAIVT